MRHADVAIVGAGLSGAIAAAMLGRAGFDVALIDPQAVYRPDFRCEKIDGTQLAVLRRTGLADAVLRVATHDRECWVARFGRLVEKRPGDQHGILYDTLVNTIRSQIPQSVAFLKTKVTDVATSDDRQTVTLATGETLSARLVVVANGLNVGLGHKLGIVRENLSKCHSVMLGFDLAPVGRRSFDFPALSYFPEQATGYRRRQGFHRCRAPVQCPHSALARHRRHGREEDRRFL